MAILKLLLDKRLDKDETIMTLGYQKKIVQFGDTEIAESISFFRGFCQMVEVKHKVLSEWLTLKCYMILLIANSKNMKYCDIWQNLFTNKDNVKECWNALDIFKFCLICLFTNVKLERMFSRMNRVKNDWRSNLG